MTGIYLIENLINGKKYVGQSIEIEKRWKNHLSASENKNEKVYQYPLYRAMRKYGKNNFRHSVLEECSRDLLNEREIYWIKKIKPEYNQTDGGNQGVFGIGINKDQAEKIQQILIADKQFSCSNIEISNKYGVSLSTITRINNGELFKRNDLQYPLRNIKQKENIKFYCADCGKKISYGSVRCRKCASVQRMSDKMFKSISRDAIKKIIRTCSSYRESSKLIGVSNSGLKIICKRLGLPTNKNEVNLISDFEWELL